MVAEYDNDDIVEDYDVIGDESNGVRRVNSAGGGPVKRPSRPVGPDRSPQEMANGLDEDGQLGMPMQKGQISQKKAKMIWFICIGVSVLCVGAMILHYALSEDPVVAPNRANRSGPRAGPTRPVANLSPDEKRIKAFRSAVYKEMRLIQSSKAYVNVLDKIDIWQESKQKSDAANSAYSDGTGDQAAAEEQTCNTLIKYYEANYAIAIYKFVFNPNDVEMNKAFFAVDLADEEQVLQIGGSNMKDKEIIRFQAADTQLSSNSNLKRMREWFTQKHIVIANVKTESKWKDLWKPAKEAYEKASLGEFAGGELEKYKGQVSEEPEQPENPEGTENPEGNEGDGNAPE
ncbi:MAG: hypothetical protein ACYTDT_11590 [Planctomycetota bacterium]